MVNELPIEGTDEEPIKEVKIIAKTGDGFQFQDRSILRKGDTYKYYINRPEDEERLLLVEVFVD
jgi:hypothetical protein